MVARKEKGTGLAEASLENLEQEEAIALSGHRDEYLRLLRENLGLKVIARNRSISLQGTDEQVARGMGILEQMRASYRARQDIRPDEVRQYLSGHTSLPGEMGGAPVEIVGPIRKLHARTAGQTMYVESIRKNDLIFCIGPAGTGKTYLSVAAALEAMNRRQIKRLVLVRPAVEAGERLGYLPGDLQAKIHPYLRPLLDALRDMLDFHQIRTFLENDVIEIAPLAYMRGRTLNDAFIILDEGQNTTVAQMQMFLTRMGMGSKVVVTGDLTQVDLPQGVSNGLEDAVQRLEGIERVDVVRMGRRDIVRNPLVQAIVDAYDENKVQQPRSPGTQSPVPEERMA